MKIIRAFFTLIAKFFISLIFLAGAVNKILHWRESEQSLYSTLCEWQANLGYIDEAHACLSVLIPLTPLLLLLTTFMEFFGGMSVLLNIKEKFGAWLLVLVLVPTTIVMHQFWFVDGMLREQQLAQFLKNLAILGGLIILILQGSEEKHVKSPFVPKI